MTTGERRVTEQNVRRCAACDGAFVVRYGLEDLIPDIDGQVHLRTEWVRCARPGCHRVQPVLVPVWAFDVAAVEWLGLPSAAPTGPTWRDVLDGSRGVPTGAKTPATQSRRRSGIGRLLAWLRKRSSWRRRPAGCS
jgi:hypothetical protein